MIPNENYIQKYVDVHSEEEKKQAQNDVQAVQERSEQKNVPAITTKHKRSLTTAGSLEQMSQQQAK